MQYRNRLFECRAYLQVKMAHGAGGDDAFGSRINGPAHNTINDWGDDIRTGNWKKGAATTGQIGPVQRCCSQSGKDVLHQTVIVFFMAHGRRSRQHAAVIRDKFKTVKRLPPTFRELYQVDIDQKLKKMKYFEFRVKRAIPILACGVGKNCQPAWSSCSFLSRLFVFTNIGLESLWRHKQTNSELNSIT